MQGGLENDKTNTLTIKKEQEICPACPWEDRKGHPILSFWKPDAFRIEGISNFTKSLKQNLNICYN